VSEDAGSRMRPWVMAGAVAAMFLWALCFPLINLGLEAAPPMTYATLRAGISGGVLLALAALLRRPPLRADVRTMAAVAAVGLFATALGFVGMFNGGALVSPGIATVVANVQPLLAAVLAWVVLDEHLRAVQRLGLFAGFGGIVLIGLPGISGGSGPLGVFYLLAGALGVAVGNVILKRIAGRVDVLRAMGWQFVVGAVPLGMLAMATEDPGAIRWSWPFLWSLLVLSLLGTAAVFVLWFYLLQRARLTQLNVFTFLTPVFGLLMGGLFFAEQVSPLAIGGILLSLAGIYLVTRPPRALPP